MYGLMLIYLANILVELIGIELYEPSARRAVGRRPSRFELIIQNGTLSSTSLRLAESWTS